MKPGFSVKEWEAIREQDLSFLQDAATVIPPFAGLTSNALAHLRDDWLTFRDEYIRIKVPTQASCNSYKSTTTGGSDQPAQIVSREQPCRTCRKTGDTEGFENLWSTTDGTRRYDATLHRQLAAPAVEVIEEIFSTRGRPEFAATPRGVGEAARAAAEHQVDSNSNTYTHLLRTGPVLYCHYGLGKGDIVELTPYSTDSIENIIAHTPGVSLQEVPTLSLLRSVNDMEPVTTRELADELNLSSATSLWERLQNLVEEDQLEENTKVNTGRRYSVWETVGSWASPIPCGECEYESHSVRGVRVHRRLAH
jgi:predicted transcriptional regulator